MTAAAPPTPKIVFAVGAPDGMTRAEAGARFEAGRLPGVSGISMALLPWLRARGHPHAVILCGSSGALDQQTARRVLAAAGGSVLVNLICEPEVQRHALRRLAQIELTAQLPLVNPSWAVNATTRPQVARRLAHQTGVRAPHCTSYRAGPLTLAEHIAAQGHRYPVLLRPLGVHGSVGLVRVEGPDDLPASAAPGQSWTVTDFVDFRSEDGLWRKYRMVYAGERLFRRHVLADADWNITGGARRFMRDRPHLFADEEEWINRPVTSERGSVEARVLHQFRALQLDFGVIDYALPPGGDLVVFEINACVQLTNAAARAAGYRLYFEANNDEILGALLAHACARAVDADGAPARAGGA